MQDMLTKIIEMDEKARKITQDAENKKIALEKDIVKTKETIHDEYIMRARKRIATNEITQKEVAEKQRIETKEKQEKSMQELNESYNKNVNTWVDTIVNNVLND